MRQEYFYALADFITSNVHGSEISTMFLMAEASDFVRFNSGKIRQPGSVVQSNCTLQLIDQGKHSSIKLSLVGDKDLDRAQLLQALGTLREQLPFLPVDPHLLINTTVQNSEDIQRNSLGDVSEIVSDILGEAEGTDLVGILASGSIYCGFANSLGQRNWFSTHNFNFDWSLVYSADKAVKTSYAGTSWMRNAFEQKMNSAKEQLQILSRPSITLKPGEYRSYLSPVALWEILGLLSWGGFGLNAQRNKISPLLQLMNKEKSLSPAFSLWEDIEGGSAPAFNESGFISPKQVPLITEGQLVGSLISPRSAKEFGVETTGASAGEAPESVAVQAGGLASEDILSTLDTGLLIGNLWYLNYSDRMSCRITGMTRFATFWVENGEIVAPVNVMRFDEPVYRILGSNLEDLSKEREFLLSARSYYHRSTASAHIPGALIRDFRFTL